VLQYGFEEGSLADPALSLDVDQVNSTPPDPPFDFLEKVPPSNQWNTTRTREFGQPHASLPLGI
jgi:hypothetical protein